MGRVRTQNMKTIKTYLFVACFSGALFVPSALSQAEEDDVWPQPPLGAGIRGANRRVITVRQGYYGVRGRFQMPSIRIPTGNFAPAGAAGGPYIADGNLANSKPGFYIGVNQGRSDIPDGGDGTTNDPIEVDAGLIFEPRTITVGTGGAARPVNPGWTPFLRTTSKYTASGGSVSTFVNASGWRAGAGTPNPNVTHFDLGWTIFEHERFGFRVGTKGGLLYVYADGASSQPTDKFTGEANYLYARDTANGTHICDTTVAMGAKRVVAMNQGGGFDNDNNPATPALNSTLTFPGGAPGIYEEDGSFLRNCTFSGIMAREVDPLGLEPSGQVISGIVPKESAARDYLSYYGLNRWTAFGDAGIDLSPGFDSTGRYPGTNDQTLRVAGGNRNLPTSRPVIEFPDIALTAYNTPTPARYNAETVNINLRNAIPVAGRRYVVGNSFNTVE